MVMTSRIVSSIRSHNNASHRKSHRPRVAEYAFSIKPFESKSFREFMLFCVPGLVALLLLISQGLDIGMGFF
jgi:hypothetical protein